VSHGVIETLDGAELDFKRKRRFKVKGVPRELEAYAVAPTAS
jgi:hypothetical protein